MSKLQDLIFHDLLPQSIKEDGIIKAVSSSLDIVLQQTALASTNLLLYARLGGELSKGMLPALERMAVSQGGLKPLSLTELEQLAWQFHVDFREVAKSNDEPAEMVKTSIAWHRIKGTPAGMKMAFDLFGMPIDIEEGGYGMHWANYQLGLGEIANIAETVALAWKIAFEMQPARCRLFRMYNDEHNIPPFIYSESKWSEGIYSCFSGVPATDLGDGWQGDDDLQLSFGARHGFESPQLTANSDIQFSGTELRSFECQYLPYPVWSSFYYSDIFPERHGFTLGEIVSFDWCDRIVTSDTWQDGNWNERPWATFSAWDRLLPEWSMQHTSISKSQLVYGHGCWSSLESCYGVPKATHENTPLIWGVGCYSDDNECEEIFLHELFFERVGANTQERKQEAIGFGIQSYTGMASPPLHDENWNKTAWKERDTWYDYRLFSSTRSIPCK